MDGGIRSSPDPALRHMGICSGVIDLPVRTVFTCVTPARSVRFQVDVPKNHFVAIRVDGVYSYGERKLLYR